MPPITVFVATKNVGKLAELRAIFDEYAWSAASFDGYRDVAEGESSYAENAALKARALRSDLERAGIVAPVVGDDSGLEVRALGDRPGILSARYGGEATWAQRRRMLLDELRATGDSARDARFVCALHYIGARGEEVAVRGTIGGTIPLEERGEGGFSYDAIFCERGTDLTFAQLSDVEKNARSHRAIAVARLVEAVRVAEAKLPIVGT